MAAQGQRSVVDGLLQQIAKLEQKLGELHTTDVNGAQLAHASQSATDSVTTAIGLTRDAWFDSDRFSATFAHPAHFRSLHSTETRPHEPNPAR